LLFLEGYLTIFSFCNNLIIEIKNNTLEEIFSMKNIKIIILIGSLLTTSYILSRIVPTIVPADVMSFAKKYQGQIVGHPLLNKPLKDGKPLTKKCSKKEKDRLIILWENNDKSLYAFYKHYALKDDSLYKTKKGIAPIDQDIVLLTKIREEMNNGKFLFKINSFILLIGFRIPEFNANCEQNDAVTEMMKIVDQKIEQLKKIKENLFKKN
jgi:hypothetical protein